MLSIEEQTGGSGGECAMSQGTREKKKQENVHLLRLIRFNKNISFRILVGYEDSVGQVVAPVGVHR